MDLQRLISDISLQDNKYILTIINQNSKEVQTKYKLDKKNIFIYIYYCITGIELENRFTISIIHID